jgi:hypothetical protein
MRQAGMSFDMIAAALDRTHGSILSRAKTRRLGKAYVAVHNAARREAAVRRHWRTKSPLSIASSLRIDLAEVHEIAGRIGLRIEDSYVPMDKNRPKLASAKLRLYSYAPADIQWAHDNRKTDRQASLVWDMLRALSKQKPIGRGYA